MLLYAITDRTLFPGDETARRTALLTKVDEWARDARVGIIQLREKDLSDDDLVDLARQVTAITSKYRAPNNERTVVLVNGSPEIAWRAGVFGVHLPSSQSGGRTLASRIEEVKAVWRERAPLKKRNPLLSVACHSVEDVRQSASLGADHMVFSPVFEKPLREACPLPGVGLEALREACKAAPGKVLALGGVTTQNAHVCVDAGAAGVAGIRLFLGHAWTGLASQRMSSFDAMTENSGN